MTTRRWRRQRCLLLRAQGWDNAQIAEHFGFVGRDYIQHLVFSAACILLYPTYPTFHPRKIVPRALWLLRMRAFNRAVARRGLERER